MSPLRVLAEDRMETSAVAIVTNCAGPALRETARAFDGVAATYDRSNAENPLLRAMRDRTRALIERVTEPGSRLLDLGCGPGTDAIYFAANGWHVTAIDWSIGMVDEASRRVRECGLEGSVDVRHLGIEQLDTDWTEQEPFDAAYSHFGPLNCVDDLSRAAHAIAARVCPSGWFVASVIGRVCPWEMAVYLARLDSRRAFVRFSRAAVPVPLEGRTVWTRYYTPGAFIRTFERAGFHPVACRALGLLTPPPYLSSFAERNPAFIARLQRIEDAVGGWPLVRGLGDHFAVVMQRRGGR